jgi:hypothetical protein
VAAVYVEGASMSVRLHLSGGTRVRKLLLTTATVLAMGGFVASAQAGGWSGTQIVGGSTSVGLGFSQSGGGSSTSSGTTFGGTGGTTNGGGSFAVNGPSYGEGGGFHSSSYGTVNGSTSQGSSTMGNGFAGSYSTSGVHICAGPTCTLP